MITDKNVVDHFYGQKTDKLGRRKFFSKLWKECLNDTNNEYHQYLLNRFDDSDDIYESLFRLRYGIYVRPVCDCCGGRTVFTKYPHYPYLKNCSKECQANNKKILERSRKTFNERYGGFGAQSQIIKDKMREGCLRNHGVEYAGQIPEQKEKVKETNLKRYGVPYSVQAEEVKKKIKKSYRDHYGVDSPMKVDAIKEKKKKTTFERYGDKNSKKNKEIRERQKQTCLAKYGYEFASQSPEVKEKMRKTCEERYGISSTCLLSQGPKSSEEDYVYEKLVEKFGEENVERGKMHKPRYEYQCDFYIKPLDMFIEYQGHEFTHWHHPFNSEDKEDIERLNLLTQKAEELDSDYYRAAINCWTYRDPMKRKTAKDNNLNFVELWSVDEAEEFIKSL